MRRVGLEEKLSALQLCRQGVDRLFVRMFSICSGMFLERLVRNILRLKPKHKQLTLPHPNHKTRGFPSIEIQDLLKN